MSNRIPPTRVRHLRFGQSAASLLLAFAFAVAACYGLVRASTNTQDHGDGLEEVVLTLRPQGLTPRRLVRRGGRFLLSVDNRTETEKLVMRLEQADGTSLRVIEVPQTAVDWSELLDLASGEYRLVEVEHPDWECLITIR